MVHAQAGSSSPTPSGFGGHHGGGHGHSTSPDLNVNAFFLACIAAFALAALPRLIARFRDRGEWGNGVLLRSRSRLMRDGALRASARESSSTDVCESP